MLAYSYSSPLTRTRVDWRYSDTCHIGLIELKPSNCVAPDASVGAFLHAVGTEILSVEVLAVYAGPISVANCGLIFILDIRHPIRFMATIFQEFLKRRVNPCLKTNA
jgi:hypothetical protein